jgi:hypothetical protein
MKHSFLIALTTATLIASALLPADNARSKDRPAQPLELKLVAIKDTYTLDLSGKSPQQFRELLKEAERREQEPPSAPGVDLVLEFRNNSEKSITIYVDGDDTHLFWELKGPGAISARYAQIITLEFRSSRPVTIAAGKSYSREIKTLEGGYRGLIQRWYWMQPGEYTLTAKYQLGGAPGSPRGRELTSNPIKLVVKPEAKNQ